MEKELKGNFDDITVELLEGQPGAFDVEVDGVVIFSRKKAADGAKRFPARGEITRLIRSKM